MKCFQHLWLGLFLGGCGEPKEAPSGDSGWVSSTSTSSTADCVPGGAPLQLVWPMDGVDTLDWVIVNYVDLNTSPYEMEDYTGAINSNAKVYDGHEGTDIGVSSFREMDAGIPVRAAAPGRVVWTVDGYYDRNTECISYDGNGVTVEHDNGYSTYYTHFRTGSVAVQSGDWVEAGDVLGMVGSSGCSTGPHLHFEVRDPDWNMVDPFLEGLWCDAPVYDAPLGLMDGWVLEGDIYDYPDPWQDPPDDVTVFVPGQTLVTVHSMGGGQDEEWFDVSVIGPDGVTYGSYANVINPMWRKSVWYFTHTVTEPLGEWIVRFRAGDSPTQDVIVEVTDGT